MDKTDQMTIAAHTAGRRNGRQWMWRFLLVAVLLLAVVAVSFFLLLTVVSQSLAVLFATLLGCTMGVVLDGQ